MIAAIAAFLVLVALANAGPVVILLHQDLAEATGPDGRRYFLRVNPTGFPWVSWLRFDRNWWTTELLWLRQLHRPRGTWTLVVTDAEAFAGDQPVLHKICSSWRAAQSDFWDAVEGVKMGRLPPSRSER